MPDAPPSLLTHLFRPGQRVAVAVSGGADSVALLRRMLEERSTLGIVLAVAHVHHGIRGGEADADAQFVEALAAAHDLPLHSKRVDALAAAAEDGNGLEDAARNLRYTFFEELIAGGVADAVATAHTRDDQAETVLHKFLRGAWTEGLSGIHPVLPLGRGSIVRPFLDTSRAEIVAWLNRLHQPWREDASNGDPAFTRNRIRHELLPTLAAYNPAIARQLSRLATIAADEDRYWQEELRRLLPSLLLPGKPTRGGGRATSTHPEAAAVSIELERLNRLHPAVGRRVLRAAARRLGARLSFDHTERLFQLAQPPGSTAAQPSGRRRIELPDGVVAMRTLRELRIERTVAPKIPHLKQPRGTLAQSGAESSTKPGGDENLLSPPSEKVR